MKSRVLKRIAAGVILVVLVAGTGLFLCRGALLRHVAGKKLEMLGQNYGLQIAYRELTMPSLSTVRLEGLTVVPEDRDTLLNLNKWRSTSVCFRCWEEKYRCVRSMWKA